MKFAVLSDVHANSTALEKVLQDATQYGVEKIICAGDVVGYGPDPVGTIRMLREHGVVTVMGNHDAVVARLRDSGDMIGHARDTDMRHRLELSQDDLDWLGSLPYIYEDEAIAVAHANFVNPALMGYVNDRLDAQQSFFGVQSGCFSLDTLMLRHCLPLVWLQIRVSQIVLIMNRRILRLRRDGNT